MARPRRRSGRQRFVSSPVPDPVPIGPPIANTQFYVADQEGTLVPPGAPGELLIGGDGVAAGYIGRPELTRERFITDPFRPESRRAALSHGRPGAVARFRQPGVPWQERQPDQTARFPHRARRDRGDVASPSRRHRCGRGDRQRSERGTRNSRICHYKRTGANSGIHAACVGWAVLALLYGAVVRRFPAGTASHPEWEDRSPFAARAR